jgi:hypothetical protein
MALQLPCFENLSLPTKSNKMASMAWKRRLEDLHSASSREQKPTEMGERKENAGCGLR